AERGSKEGGGARARAAQAAAQAAAERFKARQQRPDDDALAERLADAAKISPGDLVLVRGGTRDAGLLESLASQVRKRGGSPLITLAGDTLERKLIDGAPAEMDGKPNELDLKLAAAVTAVIDVEADDSPTELAHIP